MLCKPGEEIVGKWNGERILLLRELGSGAHGSAYLATWKGRKVVAKIGVDFFLISSEINRLKALNKAQGIFPGPSLLYYDDFVKNGCIYPFYLMSYQRGQPLNTFVKTDRCLQGTWLWIMLQLLVYLQHLHEKGYVFGDWKAEHVIIAPQNNRVHFVDAGGVTPIGEQLRQWTELYDRGSWKAGLRIAEPTYDLFAVTLLFLAEAFQCPLWRVKADGRRLSFLYDIIRGNTNIPSAYRLVFERAIHGEIRSACDYAQALTAAGSEQAVPVQYAPVWRKWLWEGCFTCSIISFLFLLYTVIR